MTLDIYKEYWKFHLRPWSGLPLFPRDMSSRNSPTTIIDGKTRPAPLNRNSFINEKQFISSVSKSYRKKDYYIQIFSDWQIEHNIFDTLFFEVDIHEENLDLAIPKMIEAKRTIDLVLDQLGVAYRRFFTGGRGFHYYLDFEPVFITDYKATAIKFLDDIGILGLVDTAVIEPARIARLPFTKHLKTKLFSVYPINNSVEELRMAAVGNDVLCEPVKLLQETTILDYLDLDAVQKKPKQDKGYIGKYDGILPECVVRIMEKILINQHALHEERIHLAGYLKRFNYDEDEIVEFFKNTSDFQYDECLKYVRSVKGHYNCANVRLLMPDLCPGICEYIRQVAKRLDDDED